MKLTTILHSSEGEREKQREVPEYTQGIRDVYGGGTSNAKWKDQRMSPEGMTSKLYIKEELELSGGWGRWMAIPGGGNSGHCCHSSSYSFLESHHAHRFILYLSSMVPAIKIIS